MEGRKIVIAITGASGAVYAKVLLDKVARLKNQVAETAVLMSDNAKTVWEYELSGASWKDYPFKFYEGNDFNAPFASGSARFDTMIVVPCHMGTLGRISTGVSNDLLTRASDFFINERPKLFLLVRDTSSILTTHKLSFEN